MLAIYRIFSYLTYLAFVIVGRFKAASGHQLWRGRLGLIDVRGPVHLWIHAASVGEIRIVGYLVDYIHKRQPSVRIHVTTMTPAGYRTAVAQMGDSVTLTYFPLDAPPAIGRTLDRIKPQVVVIAETEIWPNLICQAARRGIPMVQINGRMSPRAFNRYKLIRFLIGKLVSNYRHWFIKTDQDAERYSHLGLRRELITVAGDMKFDAPLTRQSEARQSETRSRAGVAPSDFVWIAGSTRPGEEQMLVEAYAKLRERYDGFRMIMAPRHIERVGEVINLFDRAGVRWYRFSAGDSGSTPVSDGGLVLVDTLGQLNDLYQIADLAFVGGTMVPIGGHNLLEPVWAQTPVLFGPYTDNVREATAYIKKHDYGMQVDSAEQLIDVVESVYQGRTKFALKQDSDLSNSTTAQVGTYLLRMLGDA
ncbi:MAG: 3-deoxy-D-manno-octulosonic acid transferase [candidate division Zixibacteria bacterium]|nr:3-deoxy-D-manno-octulosonic acid transferase [candidate division Zixibacteria bacterium]MDH3937402.1 3-deoxy-D-manno-octulosonic acid transferase [candidate division Zixibacteria bacterium]MDH4033305.1 3-deoxy-D-manno-octulosonic acid transferase [candidate division Zixibacteria bacterium]